MRDHLRSVVRHSWPPQDPRVYQIASLAGLFGYGIVWLDFAVSGVQTLVTLATVLLTQALCSRLWQLSTHDPHGALISGLPLCLLLRTNALSLAILTAVITIVSKFVIRWRDKHLCNPTSFGLVAMMLGTGQVWVSPGQWACSSIGCSQAGATPGHRRRQRHPWQGTETCREAEQYRASLPQRWDQEARTLASLIGWNIEDIREKMPSNGTAPDAQQWWPKLWKD